MTVFWPMMLAANLTAAGLPWLFDASFAGWSTFQTNVPNSTLTLGSNDFWDTKQLFQPAAQQFYPAAFILLGGEVEFSSYVRAHALFDSGELQPGSTLQPPLNNAVVSNEQTPTAFLRSGAVIRELELVVGHGGWGVGLGKRRHTIGHGLVYDDYAWGINLMLRGDRLDAGPWNAEVGLLILPVSIQIGTPRSPFVYAQAGYTPSFFESVKVFAAYYDDKAGSLNDVLTSAIAENLIVQNAATLQAQLTRLFLQTRQQLGSTSYLGVTMDLLPMSGMTLRGTALLQRGHMEVVQAGDHDLTLALHGWAADLQGTYEVLPYFSIGALGFAQSGANSPSTAGSTSNYGSYVAVAPFLTYTNLFFSGGVNEGFFAGRATASGFNGHGIVGAGVTASYGGVSGHVDFRAVYLGALAASPQPPVAGGGYNYGIEYDLMGILPIARWLSAGTELDMLQPGNFFPQSTLAWRFLAQLYVFGGV